MKSKLVKIVFIKNFLRKTNKSIFFFIFEQLLKYYAQFYFIFKLLKQLQGRTIVTTMHAVIETEIALIMHEIVIVDA